MVVVMRENAVLNNKGKTNFGIQFVVKATEGIP
jgi:hypothetical protein